MKHFFLSTVALTSFLLSIPLERVAAQRREPTVDDQFRERAPSDLPMPRPPQAGSNNQSRVFSNDAQQTQAIEHLPQPVGTVGPAYLGVTFNTDDRDAVVRSVAPGSPAAQANLQPGDVIESIHGRPVQTSQDVLDAVAAMRPGDMLNIEFTRRMSLRTQAALSVLPNASQRTVGYPPDATSVHEPLPAPRSSGRASSSNNMYQQPNRYVTPQSRSSSGSGQQRNYNNRQNNNNQQQDNNRGLFGRRRG
jgi:hypothetical protein